MNILQVNQSDTPKPTKDQTKKPSSKLHGNFLNKITNDETDINTEIFNERFKYQNSSCLVKDSYNGNTNIYEEVVNNVKYSLIDL